MLVAIEGVEVACYADDILIIANNENLLSKALLKLKQFTDSEGHVINYKKSAVMFSRADNRDKDRCTGIFESIPIVSQWRYLGVIVENSTKLDAETLQKENKKVKYLNLIGNIAKKS